VSRTIGLAAISPWRRL